MTTAKYSFYTPHERVILDCGDELVTKQSHKAECDINTILAQYAKTGIINHISNSEPQYLDLPSSVDFQESLALVQEASDAFASLPSGVRDRYANDPGRFLSALSDPGQRDFLREAGVLKPAIEAPPAPKEPPKPASAAD